MLSIAADVQGADVVEPIVQRFQVGFPVAVDTADVFGQAFGLIAVPDTFLVDEEGIIRVRGNGPDEKLLTQIESVLAMPRNASARATPASDVATGRLDKAAELLRKGDKLAALAELREKLGRAPRNWRIRKQIWAIEHPEKFYKSDSPDYNWQREQLEREKTSK